MSFTRHVGKQGDRKVAVVFREVPGEPHMCLVTYTELLNQHIHDPLIRCIDSDIGQQSENLADALNRTYLQDGRPILGVLHREGQLKKVQTTSILMTPNPTTKIRLDELNKMLDEMKLGEDAIKKMSELDQSAGIQSPGDIAKRMRANQTPVVAASADVLGDAALAKSRVSQANKMAEEARGLLAESARLMEEAKTLDPTLAPKPVASEATTVKRKYTRKVANVA
jgi:hypothetical protein